MNGSDVNQIAEAGEKAAVECFAQLTRFVVRKQMTKEEAAVLAWDMATEFSREYVKRVLAREAGEV